LALIGDVATKATAIDSLVYVSASKWLIRIFLGLPFIVLKHHPLVLWRVVPPLAISLSKSSASVVRTAIASKGLLWDRRDASTDDTDSSIYTTIKIPIAAIHLAHFNAPAMNAPPTEINHAGCDTRLSPSEAFGLNKSIRKR